MPSIDDLSMLEKMDYMRSLSVEINRLEETLNTIPHSHEDQEPYAYIATQFDWGRRTVPFWSHPSEDYRGFKGTVNILGR